MKLRGKLIAIALIPIFLLSGIVCVVTGLKVSEAMKSEIFTSLQAAVYEERDNITMEGANVYTVDENQILWNGSKDITNDTETIDLVKKNTGIVLTVFYGDTRYKTSVTKDTGERVLYTQAGSGVIDKVLKGGNEYHAENVDVVGSPYYAYYIPLYDDTSSSPVGMVFAGKAQASCENQIKSIIMNMIFITLALVVVSAVTVFLIASAISKRLAYGVSSLEKLANGELNIDIDRNITSKKDETGDIARSVKNLKDQLTDVVSGIVDKSHQVNECANALDGESNSAAGTVEQVEKAILEIAEGATSQAADTTKATEDVIVMGNLVEETNQSVELLTTVSDEMEISSNNASGTLGELKNINEKAKESIEVIYEQTNTTNESAKKISEAINLIKSIAEETNLLSLNASIEAARAGEQGRGFAVVASQISKLAEQSNESAQKIEEIIRSLMEDSQKAVETMEGVNEIMAQQSEMVDKTADTFNEVLDGIKKSRTQITTISTNMEGLNASRQSVVDVVSNLSAIAEENAASTEETSASSTVVNQTIQEMAINASTLLTLAKELEQTVDVFKL